MPTTSQVLLLAAALFAAAPAKAQDAPERNRYLVSTFFVTRFLPFGLDAQASLTFNHHIGNSEDILFKTRFLSLTGTATYNPAEWSVQAALEYEPIAVFQLRAWYEYRGYFGQYGEILSWNHTVPDISDAAITAEEPNAQAAGRSTFRLEPKLRIAYGPIGVQDVVGLSYGTIGVRSGDISYFDPGAVMTMPVNGFTVSNQLSVVYLAGPLTAGALWEYFAPQGIGPDNQVHRVGVVAAYTFFDAPRAYVNKPTLIALATYNVVQRTRAGLWPTLVFGVSTETDLFIRR